MKECYYISKYTNTSYKDTLDITPSERAMLLKIIEDEAEKKAERDARLAEELKAKMNNK